MMTHFPYSALRRKFRHLKFMIALSAPLNKHIRCSGTNSNVRLTKTHKLTRKHEVSCVFTPSPCGPSVKQWVELTTKTWRTIKLLHSYVNNARSLK